MASDKKKTGYSLADKCRDEEDKLRDELAKQLKSDMKRYRKITLKIGKHWTPDKLKLS